MEFEPCNTFVGNNWSIRQVPDTGARLIKFCSTDLEHQKNEKCQIINCKFLVELALIEVL